MTRTRNKKTKGQRKPNVFSLLKPYKKLVIILVIFTLIGNGVNLIIPQIISYGIDSFSHGNFVLKTIIIQFVGASFIILLFTYLQQIMQTYAAERVAFDLRKKLTDKISRQSFSFIQKSDPSKLLTNLTSDMDSIKMFVSMAVTTIISSVFIIIATSILLFTINWKLALPVILMVPAMMITFYLVLRKVGVLFKRSREIIDWLNRVINESILGSMIIRVVNSQQTEYKKFLEANTEAKNVGISILTLFAILIPIVTFVSNIAVLTILAYGGHLVIDSSLTLGDFAAFNSYVSILIFPIIMIGFMSGTIAQASASFARIQSVLNTPDTSDTGTQIEEISEKIELKNVSVLYKGKPALKSVSLSILKEQHTAIIGPTAAGKTQLLYALTGLIKPNDGQILYDDILLENFDKESFHNQVGFVFQDNVMFNMSIRDNIAFNDSATEETIKKAIQTAELNDFIETLPAKINTIVSERGTSLSGGQKQRIMLARALALNPKILLLDDFTARVDSQTEQKILKNVIENYPEITLISVTQKIDSVKDYDKIVLLMEGEIVAQGTHTELLKASPEYNQIYNSQLSTNHYELQS